jgi:hypothetical protein
MLKALNLYFRQGVSVEIEEAALTKKLLFGWSIGLYEDNC